MTLLSAFITALLFSNYFEPVHLFRLNIKATEIALKPSNSNALKNTFIKLRESKQYESIQNLLELETFDTMVSYVESCTMMNDQDYKSIIEYFYSKNEVEKLSKILSPDCVVSMKESYFHDSSISFSIRDLPKSLLSANIKAFCFRTKSLKYAYIGIILHALDKRFTDINWDNFAYSPRLMASSQEHLPFAEAFSPLNVPVHFKSDIFYYLSHTMLKDSTYGGDVLWLVQAVLPLESAPLPPNIAKLPFIKPKVLSVWNEQLFRVVSTLNFYFELVDIQKTCSKRSAPQDFKEKVDEAIILASQSLERFNEHTRKLLDSNLSCKPFKQILSTISGIYSIFLTETVHRSAFINQIYLYISKTFSLRAPAAVQGDWLCNLFFLFWKRKLRSLNIDAISESIRIFFSRNPTINSIAKAQYQYVSAFNYINPNNAVPTNFEQLIPLNRLEEVYEKFPWILTTRVEDVSFKLRWKIHLSNSRKRLSDINVGNYGVRPIKELPSLPADHEKIPSISHKKKLIENFRMTVRALNNFDSRQAPIRSFTTFDFIGNNFIKSIGIREGIQQFFKLILEIDDFRIILNKIEDGRPVIIITPIISKDVGNILGQALAVATILNVRIPFLIHKTQLEAIFKENEQVNQELLQRIKQFCSKTDYLNLLSYDKEQGNSLYFWKSLEKYFNFFLSWKSLFYKSKDLESNSESLIEEYFSVFNRRILIGFKYHYLSSRFSFDEIVKILS